MDATAPTTPPEVQLPGCLPPGATIDSMLTVKEFSIYARQAERTVENNIRAEVIPAVRVGRKEPLIHVRTFLYHQGKAFKYVTNITRPDATSQAL